MKKTKIIVLANQKGGVGKTTAAVTIAVGMACRNKRVLVIDLDPQASAGRAFRIPESPAIMNMLMNDVSRLAILRMVRDMVEKPYPETDESEKPAWVEYLHVLPGDKRTSLARDAFQGQDHLPLLRERIEQLFFDAGYDYIILDTSPSVGGIQEPAVWAADYLLIPVTPEQGAYDGLSKLLDDVEAMSNLRDGLKWQGSLLGVILNEFESNKNLSIQVYEALRNHFGDRLLGPIHRTTYFPQASGAGKSIYEWDPNGRAVKEYNEIIDFILRAR